MGTKRRLLLAVLLCVASASAGPAPTKRAIRGVSIDDMAFSPDKIEIKVGEVVEWTNNDVRDHNVTAKDGSFKSENLSNGATFRFTFKKPGKFPYACTLHPRMKGTVVVQAE